MWRGTVTRWLTRSVPRRSRHWVTGCRNAWAPPEPCRRPAHRRGCRNCARLPRLAAMLGPAELVVVVLALAPDGSSLDLRRTAVGQRIRAVAGAGGDRQPVHAAADPVAAAAGAGRHCGDRAGHPDRGGLRRHRARAVRGAGRQLRQWHQLLAFHPRQRGNYGADRRAGAALLLRKRSLGRAGAGQRARAGRRAAGAYPPAFPVQQHEPDRQPAAS